MKSTRAFFLSVLLCLMSGFAFADGLPPGDPAIEINDPICTNELGPCAPLVSPLVPFTFNAGADGNTATPGSFEVNPASNGFFSLDVQTAGTFDILSCTSNAFACDITVLAGGVTNFYFHQPVGCEFECGGFPPGDVFTISLLGFRPFEDFTAIANLTAPATTSFISTPEPSMLLLFGSGGILALRRKLKFRKN